MIGRSLALCSVLGASTGCTTARSEALPALLDLDTRVHAVVFEAAGAPGQLVLRPIAGRSGEALVLLRDVEGLPPSLELMATARVLEDGSITGVLHADHPAPAIGAPYLVPPIVLAGRIGQGDELQLSLRGAEGRAARSTWRRASIHAPRPFEVTRHTLRAAAWTPIPVPADRQGSMLVRMRGSKRARGLFLPAGAGPHDLPVESEERDLILARTHWTNPPPDAPWFFERDGVPVWFLPENRQLTSGHWTFWAIDGLEPEDLLPIELEWEGILPDPVLICDPSVHIEVVPSIVAPGEPVRITVTASAEAGVDQFGWNVFDTPEPFAEGVAELGEGATTVSRTWTRTFSTPGDYGFRASASDMLHRTDAAGPHTTAEACGNRNTYITVKERPRRTYRVGFALLTPVGTDPASPEVLAQLAKIREIKVHYEREFAKATDFAGAVDVSHPTVVLAPPGPVYGLLDGDPLVEQFTRGATQFFFERFPDDFDFLAFYEMYPDKRVEGRHMIVRTAVAGLGRSPIQRPSLFGSAGRLRGVGLVSDITDLPEEYGYLSSRMLLLLHESIGHQWGVYASALRTGGSHYDGVAWEDHTILYARPWREISPGTLQISPVDDPETGWVRFVFHPWTLYLAGLKERHEVPASVLKVTPAETPSLGSGITTSGTTETITLESVIASEGDRYDVR